MNMTGPDEHNPYEAQPDVPADLGVSTNASVEFEPHLRGDISISHDESERAAGSALAASTPSDTDAVDHSVWDEPGLSPKLAGPVPQDALTYARWLAERIAATSPEKSWLITLGLAACAGIFAIFGTLATGFNGMFQGIIFICVIGPVTEEVMKVALAIWVVEKHPYLFKSALQIILCAAVSGVVFAAVENLLYLNVYIPHPQVDLVHWRWTVCVAMHGGCSLIAGVGLTQIWADCVKHQHRPRLFLGSRLMITAILIQAVYNCFAVAMSLADM